MVDRGEPGVGTFSCALLLPDGRRVTVGSWSYADMEDGVWAFGIDRAYATAPRMEILDDHGAVVATASLA